MQVAGSSMMMRQPYNPRAQQQQQQQQQAAEELSLTNLPNDILRILLVQSGIGASELCALECTAWLLRQLIDDSVWQHAFLQRRRCNVLREPDCWKQEFSRRDLWSRDWRQIIGYNSLNGTNYGGQFAPLPPGARAAYLMADSEW